MEPVTSGPYALKSEPSIWSDFQRILTTSGSSATLKKLERFAFFDAAKDHNVALTIATGKQRLYANLLIQIGLSFRTYLHDPKSKADSWRLKACPQVSKERVFIARSWLARILGPEHRSRS